MIQCIQPAQADYRYSNKHKVILLISVKLLIITTPNYPTGHTFLLSHQIPDMGTVLAGQPVDPNTER